MLLNEKGRHGRRLRVAPHASIDRVSSSSRELLAMKASEVESAEASLVSTLSLIPAQRGHGRKTSRVFNMFRSFLDLIPIPPIACKTWLALPSGRSDQFALGNRVTGTIFGYRKGHVYFAVQEDPRAEPVLLLELATPTNSLVKEMASGLVRIALECERTQNRGKLFLEPVWTMYCNGRKTGYAIRRSCSETDLQVLTLVQAISMGAGVLPKTDEEGPDGELMYMRAKFERVVGSKDSEAFYMMNPDGTGGPELSIFLLRI
ncbi:hypothetical protein L7F22_059720 [Adiantum nelumboides]|nr:hypothetical protein [Adiantum nelumboides]